MTDHCRRIPILLATVIVVGIVVGYWRAPVPRGLLLDAFAVTGVAAGFACLVRAQRATWSRRAVWAAFGASVMTAVMAAAWMPPWLVLVALLLGAGVFRRRSTRRRWAFFGALCLFACGAVFNVYALSAFVTHTPLNADPATFRALDLRVHGFLADAPLRDVWAIHLPGGGAERSVLGVLRAPADRGVSAGRPSGVVALLSAVLVGLRLGAGWVLRWDTESAADAKASYADRVTAADRARCIVKCPGDRIGPFGFRSLYTFDREMTYEVQNRTAHVFLTMSLVPETDGYTLYYAVFVKRTSWLTPVYMATIDPFRRLVMYPVMLRNIQSRWRAAWSQ